MRYWFEAIWASFFLFIYYYYHRYQNSSSCLKYQRYYYTSNRKLPNSDKGQATLTLRRKSHLQENIEREEEKKIKISTHPKPQLNHFFRGNRRSHTETCTHRERCPALQPELCKLLLSLFLFFLLLLLSKKKTKVMSSQRLRRNPLQGTGAVPFRQQLTFELQKKKIERSSTKTDHLHGQTQTGKSAT